MTRKTYTVVVDTRTYQINLTEAEREKLIRHYHGFVSITEVQPLDFDAIAKELGEA